MLEEATILENLEVFTPWGVKIGDIAGLEIDSEAAEIENIFIEETNDRLVQNGEPILIPYRWVQAVGDIVILRHFPPDIPIASPENLGMREFQ
jgi:sporulation protein YlmC with PRC-barrel domain